MDLWELKQGIIKIYFSDILKKPLEDVSCYEEGPSLTCPYKPWFIEIIKRLHSENEKNNYPIKSFVISPPINGLYKVRLSLGSRGNNLTESFNLTEVEVVALLKFLIDNDVKYVKVNIRL